MTPAAGAEVPLRGKLEKHALAAVLRALLREGRDGCLTVSRGAITRRLYLHGGMIIYGSSTEPHDRLGVILVEQGKLSRADLKKYWEESQASNRLLGITLVLNGLITLNDLYHGITAQVVTILDRLQKWRKGDYEFDEGREPDAGTVLLRIPLVLYLRGDSEKKPAPKKAAKGARSSGRKAGPGTQSEPDADASARVAPAGDEEEELEIQVDAPEPPAVAPAAAPAAGSERRAADEASDAAEVAQIAAEVAAHVAQAAQVSAQVAAEAIAEVSPEAIFEADFVGEVSFMVQELRQRLGQDPFTLLGVPAASDRATVQAAFYRIAKVLHPDRLPRSCPPDLLHEAEEIFREITTASQAAEEELRRRVPAQHAAAPPSPEAKAHKPLENPAQALFVKGREWIKKRNYWQAADALRQAVRLKPDDALYRQYLGLSLIQTKRLHEAEEHLSEACHLEPNNPAHLVNLGRAYRSGRLFRKSREAFEKALRIDPGNEAARDELRDLPDEQPQPRKPESVGIFKKLFGKG